MAYQFLFTSLLTTLRGGSGYGIVAESHRVPKVLSEEITRIAAYKEVYPSGDPNHSYNPVNYFFYIFNPWCIVGKIALSKNDYTGRFNYLGEFFALEQSELPDAGPVSLLEALPFQSEFHGEARLLPPCVLPNVPSVGSKVCHQWASLTGDPGWGGVLAETLHKEQNAWVLYDKSLHGKKCLSLIGESLNLLSPAERWRITFSTHVEGFPKGNQVRLRMLQQGGAQSLDFKSNPECLNLAKEKWPAAEGGDWLIAARTGIQVEAKSYLPKASQQGPNLTLNPIVHVTGSMESKGVGVPYGIPSPPRSGLHKVPEAGGFPPSPVPPPPKGSFANEKKGLDRPFPDHVPPIIKTRGVSLLFYFLTLAAGIVSAFGLGIWLGIFMHRTGLKEKANEVAIQRGEMDEMKKDTVEESQKTKNIIEGNKDKIETLEKNKTDLNGEIEKLNISRRRFTDAKWPGLGIMNSNTEKENDDYVYNYLQQSTKFNKEYGSKENKIKELLKWETTMNLSKKEEDLVKKIKDCNILDDEIIKLLSFDVKHKDFLNDLLKSDKRPTIIYGVNGEIEERIKKLDEILIQKKFQMKITKQIFEKVEKVMEDKILFTEQMSVPNVDFNTHKLSEVYFKELTNSNKKNDNGGDQKKQAKEFSKNTNVSDNDCIFALTQLNLGAKGTGLIFANDKNGDKRWKISYQTTRHIFKNGEAIKKYIGSLNQDKNHEKFTDLILAIDNLTKLKEILK